jgi:hypothetical protein
VRWEIRRANDNTVIWARDGHDAIVDGTVLDPGTYKVTFKATAYGETKSETRTVVVEALPPGATKPVPSITKPTGHKVLYTGGTPVELKVAGTAMDKEDGQLPGTRFRWLATAGTKTVVLCTGSQFKAPTGNGPAVAGAPKDCSKATVQLPVSPLAPGKPTWTIRLQVRDFSDRIGVDVVYVDVLVVIG